MTAGATARPPEAGSPASGVVPGPAAGGTGVAPRRIALFTEYYLPHFGGIELHVRSLADHLRRAGHEVTVVTPFPGPEEIDGIPVLRLGLPLLPFWHTVVTPRGIRPFDRVLRSGRFDLLHCHHSVYSPATACAAYLGQRAGIPTVVTFHSVLNGYTRAFALWAAAAHWDRWPLTLSAVSPRITRELAPLVRGRPVEILPNGIEAAAWPPRSPTPSGDLRVVSTMRLVRRKRPRALVELMALVRERLPAGMRLRARIVGEGVERARLERLIAGLHLGGEVELCGRLAHDAIRALYADADLFVLPTLEESFGLAALEARAAGLPLVVMRESGAAGFIEHERDGLLADSDAELAAAVLRLAHDSELRARMAAHNRETPPPFPWEEVTRTHLDVYRNAAREAACSSG
jgi:glycosyltransferase involved in cell wall biosynthesis